MGCGNSKIPKSPPGQVLKFIGHPKIDKIYEDYEIFVREVDHIRTEVDLRFSDFIKSLGAAKLWEIYNDFTEILKMYFLVLAINLKGEMRKIKYNEEISPFIHVNKKRFSYYAKKTIDNFEDYAIALKFCKEKLDKAVSKIDVDDIRRSIHESQDIQELFDSGENLNAQISERKHEIKDKDSKIVYIKKTMNWIYDNIIEILKDNKYSKHEMIASIEIIDNNNKSILKSCEAIELYQKLQTEFKESLRTVYQEINTSQRKDKMIQQIAQAVHEKIFIPSEVVSYFWPYPDR